MHSDDAQLLLSLMLLFHGSRHLTHSNWDFVIGPLSLRNFVYQHYKKSVVKSPNAVLLKIGHYRSIHLQHIKLWRCATKQQPIAGDVLTKITGWRSLLFGAHIHGNQ